MPQNEEPLHQAPSKSNHGKRNIWLGVVAVVLVVALLLGRNLAISWACDAAAARVNVGELGAAEAWLSWTTRMDPDDSRVHLVHAACFRHRGERQNWDRTLARAEQEGGRRARTQLERNLGQLHFGEQVRISPGDYEAMQAAGASPRDAATAVVHGLLSRQQFGMADQLIKLWAEASADEGHASYLRGMSLWTAGRLDEAYTALEKGIAEQPNHEMARTSLARVLEQQERFSEALQHYSFVARAAPQHEAVQIGLARVLRKTGRADEARNVLTAPTTPDQASESVALEIAVREYETGNYSESRRWFERIDLDKEHVADTLRTAASALALSGDRSNADRLFCRIDDAQHFARQSGELQRRLNLDPSDQVAAAELERLQQWRANSDLQAEASPTSRVPADPLYLERCAACHGANGDGQGSAARFLYPRPRNLRDDDYRLVSSLNRIPTEQDIEKVIRRGIPGTAMVAFPDATKEQMRQLIVQVQRFRQTGIRQALVAEREQAAESIDKQQLERSVTKLMTPSPVIQIQLTSTQPAATERGKKLYSDLGCHHCHGSDGEGSRGMPLDDMQGRPVAARDLTRDPMKGGADVGSLFLRIRLGMPGTPHPGVSEIADEDLLGLVHYCLSLSVQPTRALTNHQRALRAATWIQPVRP